MIVFRHHIRKQHLEIEVNAEAIALALQPRLSDFNRRRFLPVLERICNELAPPGRHIKIDRLEIDLGTMQIDEFEEVAPERLSQAFRRVLDAALRHRDTLATERPQQEALADLLAHYLRYGTFPFWAPPGRSPYELMTELAEHFPARLVKLIKTHGSLPRIRERIVLQFGAPLLHRLFHLLEPAHAALIIAYLIDLETVHRVEPLLPLGEAHFGHLIWAIALSYLVHDRGTQFNRKSFVKWLLVSSAARQGVKYGQLLITLHRGLERTEQRHPLPSSLPAIIQALVHAYQQQAPPPDDRAHDTGGLPWDRAQPGSSLPAAPSGHDTTDALGWLAHFLRHGQWPEALSPPTTDGSLLPALPQLLATRAAARTRHCIERIGRTAKPGRLVLIGRLSQVFSMHDLLALLAPHLADALWGVIGLLTEPGAPLAHQPERVRQALLYALLEGTGKSGTVDSQLRHLVEVVARQTDTQYDTLAPMLLAAPDTPAAPPPPALSKAHIPSGELHRWPVASLAPPPFVWPKSAARPPFTPYDQIGHLHDYLRDGQMPWDALLANPSSTIEGLLLALPDMPQAPLRQLFAHRLSAAQRVAFVHAVQALSEAQRGHLLSRLLPTLGQPRHPFQQTLEAISAHADDLAGFQARLLEAVLAGRSLDLELRPLAPPPLSEMTAVRLPNALATGAVSDLLSALVTRLQSRATVGTGTPQHPVAALVRTLLAKHPAEAALFLRALRDQSALRSALIQQTPPSLFPHLLAVLHPDQVTPVMALQTALARIPSPYQPASKIKLRQIFFHRLLYLEQGKPLSVRFYTQVLHDLFAVPLADPVRVLLLQSVASWEAGGPASVACASAFREALAAVSATPPPEGQAPPLLDEAPRLARPPTDTAALPVALQKAVLAVLLGGLPDSTATGRSHTPGGTLASPLLSAPMLRFALQHLAEEAPEQVAASLRPHMADRHLRASWVRLLPEAALVRLSYLLEPRTAHALLQTAELIAFAWEKAVPPAHPSLTSRTAFWELLLAFLTEHTVVHQSAERLVTTFFRQYATLSLAALPSHSDAEVIGSRLLDQATRLAHTAGRTNLLALFRKNHDRLLALWKTPLTQNPGVDTEAPPQPLPAVLAQKRSVLLPPAPKPAFGLAPRARQAAQEDIPDAPIYIDNAGLILTSPFLPRLFNLLDLMEEAHGPVHLRDPVAAARAVHLLQYLVDARTAAPEPLLVLNKILCGVPLSAPIARNIEISAQEQDCCERLLETIIAHWKIIEHTSIAGLRETFLQRQGKLTRSPEAWKLVVQRKTLDILVDQIPWSIGIVYHRWMQQQIYVSW